MLPSFEQVVTQAQAPEARRVEPFLIRKPYLSFDSTALTAAQWRAVVARAPIARTCISTLQLQIQSVPWRISGKDPRLCDEYRQILEHANGENFKIFLSRVIRDTLEVPFGGAAEVVRYPDGKLYTLLHVDGGSLAPTYDEEQPYVQLDPARSWNRVYFKPGELVRLPWQMQTSLLNYGWTFTPIMDALPAMEALIRSDVFYNTLLSDTPPPGILDLLDMDQQSAIDWAKSFRETFEGIDRFKIPVLYDHKVPANWIAFQDTSITGNLADIVKRYAEIVAAAFGMSIVDLGLYEYAQTRAGSTAQLDASKRQGLGALLVKISDLLNQEVLPDEVKFEWDEIDREDSVRRATASKTTVDALAAAVNAGLMDAEEARANIEQKRLFTLLPGHTPKPPEPAPPGAGGFGQGQTGAAPEGGQKGEEGAPAKQVKAPATREEGGAKTPAQRSLYSTIFDEGGRLEYAWDDCECEHGADGRVTHAASAESQGEAALADLERDPAYRRLYTLMTDSFERLTRAVPLGVVRRAVEEGWAALDALEGRQEQAGYEADVLQGRILAVLDSYAGLDLPDSAVQQVVAAMAEAYSQGLLEAANDGWDVLRSVGLAEGELPKGLAFNLTSPEMLAALEANAVELKGEIDQGTRNIVARLIAQGVREGRSAYAGKDSIAATIHAAFPEAIGKRRARSIALFEVNQCETLAHLRQFETMGLSKKRWDAIPALACEVCMANDRLGWVPLDYAYQNVFGPCQGPPGHPTRCHCAIRFDREELLSRAREGGLFEVDDGGGVHDVALRSLAGADQEVG